MRAPAGLEGGMGSRWMAVVAAGLALTGCETLDKGQCLQGDWSAIGYADGVDGYPASRINDHGKACAQYGVAPDARVYYASRERGLPLYCTPARGFLAGRNGDSYKGVCPPPLERGFLAGFADGGLVHDAQARVDHAESDRSSADSRRRRLDRDIRDEEARMDDPKTTDEQRRSIREHLRRLRDDRRRVDDDWRDASYARDAAERDLSMVRARFTPIYGTW